jgi:transposase
MAERRKFTRDYKLAAIQPLLAGEKSVTQQAADLGIGRTELQRWLSAFKSEGAEAFPGSGHQTSEQAQITELKRRLREAEMERDILKKALSIFGKDQK